VEDRLFQSRPMAMGRRGAVATPHLLASQAALDVLRDGGNAVDAAVAAAVVCTVVQPFSSSIGGLGWATVYDAQSGTTEVLQFHGSVPSGIDPSVFRRDAAGLVDWRLLEAEGRALLGSLTPGLVPGWQELLLTKGTWSLRRILERPIALAMEGFAVSEALHDAVMLSAERLRRWPSSAATFLPHGDPPAVGDRLVQLDLGATLQRIADNGAAEMVEGRTAQIMVAFYREHGGVLSASDLSVYRPTWHPPLVASYGDHVLHATPAPFGDVSFVAGLKLLEELGPFAGAADPGYIHASVEAAKLVAAERARYLGEGADSASVAWLLSPEHLRSQRAKIGPRAAPAAASGRGPEDTITLVVVDEAGNAVHLMQTVGNLFGTGAVVDSAGFFANSSMYFVYVDHDGLNRIVPGGKVEQNPCLGMLFDADGHLRLVAGSPGGKTRVETVRQMIVNVVDFGMNVQQAVDAPRFLTSADGRFVDFESRYGSIDAELIAQLEARGHQVRSVAENFGVGAAVAIQPGSSTRMAAADWRLESVALAY
jgi:gamma-glutamyltranspeptidase / glutathione hydrolase